jgi:hypothetical protein
MKRRKILPQRDSNYDPSAVQPVVRRYIDCTIPAPLLEYTLKYKVKHKGVIYGEMLKVTLESRPNFVVSMECRVTK